LTSIDLLYFVLHFLLGHKRFKFNVLRNEDTCKSS